MSFNGYFNCVNLLNRIDLTCIIKIFFSVFPTEEYMFNIHTILNEIHKTSRMFHDLSTVMHFNGYKQFVK